jgi:hypothetical protein
LFEIQNFFLFFRSRALVKIEFPSNEHSGGLLI